MIIECHGEWADGAHHRPVMLGEQYPLSNGAIVKGACDRCVRAMGATLSCRACRKVQTQTGLCGRCEAELEAHLGEPAVTLTVYRVGGDPLSGTYNGAGAIGRLRTAMQQLSYCGFSLQPLAVPA